MTTVQTPLPQAKQLASHALLQQTPSRQKPLAHSCPDRQLTPSIFKHSPRASHMRVSAQVRGSTTPVTGAHVPVAQLRQGASQRASQQSPPTQKPEAHSPAAPQRWPFPFRQPPRPSQAVAPPQLRVPSRSGCPTPTGAQVPPAPVQASHRPQVALQQRPSRQAPETHW
jgi:hypothetical protein